MICWNRSVPLATSETVATLWSQRNSILAVFSAGLILLYLAFHFGLRVPLPVAQIPLLAVLVLGGAPLVIELLQKLWKREFGSDLLAGVSIVTSALLGEYLAGSIVVLMLS